MSFDREKNSLSDLVAISVSPKTAFVSLSIWRWVRGIGFGQGVSVAKKNRPEENGSEVNWTKKNLYAKLDRGPIAGPRSEFTDPRFMDQRTRDFFLSSSQTLLCDRIEPTRATDPTPPPPPPQPRNPSLAVTNL